MKTKYEKKLESDKEKVDYLALLDQMKCAVINGDYECVVL